MTTDFKIIQRYRGYENRQDETTVDNKQHGVLLKPSQNVLVTSDGLVQSRGGTEKFGEALGSPVVFNEYWVNNIGNETTLITADKKLYASLGEVWVKIKDVNTNELDMAIWWDNPFLRDITIFTQSNGTLLHWNGIIGEISEIDDNKFGVTGKNMYSNYNVRIGDNIIINDVVYNVTAFDGDLAVVDKTIVGDIGDVFYGEVGERNIFSYTENYGDHSIPTDQIDIDFEATRYFFTSIGVDNNQLILGSNTSHIVFRSKNSSWFDFRYNITKGRVVGEGDKFVLDEPVTAIEIEPQKGRIIISCNRDNVYEVKDIDITINAEVPYSNTKSSIRKLLSGFDSAFMSKYSQALVKDSLAFISADGVVNTLSRIENLDTQQGKPLSWLINKELTTDNLVGSNMLFIKNNLYVSMPTIGQIMIYDFEQAIWQPPVKLPVSSIGIKDGKPFYFDISGQAHWLFIGTSDNGNTFIQRAVFHYEDNSSRGLLKKQHKNYTEGYLSNGGEIDIKLIYDFAGSSGVQSRTIIDGEVGRQGSSLTKFYDMEGSFGLGRYGFGTIPFGQTGETELGDYNVRVAKFRDFFVGKSPSFFEQRFEIGTEKLDTVFALIAYGQNTTLSKIDPDKQ